MLISVFARKFPRTLEADAVKSHAYHKPTKTSFMNWPGSTTCDSEPNFYMILSLKPKYLSYKIDGIFAEHNHNILRFPP
jgi:hypothetical protein